MQIHDDPLPGDAFGEALKAHVAASPHDHHFVERSDGVLDDMPHAVYFTEPDAWPTVDQACLDRLSGRVLDIGAGAGRATLAARHRGHDATALDISPGALEVCRGRGIDDLYLGSVESLAAEDAPPTFDTFLMMGNNLGLLGGPDQAAEFLAALHRLAAPGARVVGTAGHIYKTEDPLHLEYHERNRTLGRMAGELRLRIRFRRWAGEWFDYLFASPEELDGVAAASGWRLTDVVEDEGYVYLAELRPA